MDLSLNYAHRSVGKDRMVKMQRKTEGVERAQNETPRGVTLSGLLPENPLTDIARGLC